LNSHLTLLNVLPELEFVYWPAVVDFKLESLKARPDGSVDVGFLEGLLRTEADVANAKLMRQKCKIIVAFGSCPSYGSVAGMANLFEGSELTARKFLDMAYVDKDAKIPNEHVPKILDKIPDIHKVVKIDIDLPGCPPVPGNIIGLISYVLGAVDTKVDNTRSMCDVCPLSTCLLKEGKLCAGPITAVGDKMEKLKRGYPILGEYGLTAKPHPENAALLLDKLTANPLSHHEIQQVVECLLMLIPGTHALGYLAGKNDPIRKAKLNPSAMTMKKIAHPTNLEKEIEVVDFQLEGYPPIVLDNIGAMMAELKNNPEFDDSARTVCSSCPRNLEDKKVAKFKRDYEGFPDFNECLLNQGYVCMGPITRAGCGTLCPKANSPCLGCYGPALNVDDFPLKAMSYFPALSSEDPQSVKEFFKDPAGLFGRFTTVVSKLNHKIDDHGEK
jgi:coenzyme F420-reducing hydrogenase gamma subunit